MADPVLSRPIYVDVGDWLSSRPSVLVDTKFIKTDTLITAFLDWCLANGRRYHRSTVIGRALRHYLPNLTSMQVSENGRLVRYYGHPYPMVDSAAEADDIEDLL